MGIDTTGTVRMREESDRGVAVKVFVDDKVLRLVSEDQSIGQWNRSALGITALHEGFLIRAEGEEFVLVTEDDAAVAEEFGMSAATPRLARKVAASHPPQVREEVIVAEPPRSQLMPIALAVAGVFILAGGVVLRASPSLRDVDRYWGAFLAGGLMMVAIAYILARGRRWAGVAAALILMALVGVLIVSAQSTSIGASEVFAYIFIAGGLVVGVSVVFSGGLTNGS